MKKYISFILLIGGLVGVVASLSIVLNSVKYEINGSLLFGMWILGGLLGFIIADNAIKIDRGIIVSPNLVKILFLPMTLILFVVSILLGYTSTLFFLCFEGAFGIMFAGLLLVLKNKHNPIL